LQARDDFLTDICERLLLAQDVMKASHDSKPRAVEFSVGDWVLLRLHHRTAVDITTSTSKLAPGYYGPFQIARIGNVAYCLQLPENAKIHDVCSCGSLEEVYWGTANSCSSSLTAHRSWPCRSDA